MIVQAGMWIWFPHSSVWISWALSWHLFQDPPPGSWYVSTKKLSFWWICQGDSSVENALTRFVSISMVIHMFLVSMLAIFFSSVHPLLIPAARETIPPDPEVVMLLSYHLCSKSQSSSPAEDSEEVQVKLEACDLSPLLKGQLWAWRWDVLSCWGLPSAVEWTKEAELWIIT